MDATPDAKPMVPERIRPFRRLMGAFGDRMPKGLYARALIIIIAPMVLLQSVLTFVFLERHWQTVTRRLSSSFPPARSRSSNGCCPKPALVVDTCRSTDARSRR